MTVRSIFHRCRLLALVTLAGALASAPGALASHEPQIDPDGSKLPYQPIGHFKPGDPLPAADDAEAVTSLMEDGIFNPSGTFNAFDTNVFEVLALPYRSAGDPSGGDPYGNGGNPEHGRCGDDPGSDERPRKGDFSQLAGACPNHQLEYLAHYERTMGAILNDFGVTFRRYKFDNPGGSTTQAGDAYNPAAIVPGSSHPDQTVIIGAHYDQTDDGPASAWDSQEGHAQLFRVAKLMADYWKSTETRPAATVKFIPWDGEESGTLGSEHYAQNNIVPGRAADVRGYFNTDPCAGGYPAFRYGNPLDRVDLGIQLAHPKPSEDPATLDDTKPPADAGPRFEAFNAAANQWVEQTFEQIDDALTLAPGLEREIFVSTEEGKTSPFGGDIGPGKDVVIGNARPLAFSSDWRNFETLGIPFFNPGPDITGPSSQLEPGNPDALAILHSPLDNMQTLNAYTGGSDGSGGHDLTGRSFSEGWIKGMEMCAHMLAWGMVQPEQGGATPVADGPVAYYEALPNEAGVGDPVTFDARGTHRLGDGKVAYDGLTYAWDFGDGTSASGDTVSHAYARKGVYDSRLTVTDAATGKSDTMTIPVTVTRGAPMQGPDLEELEPEQSDGNFELTWAFNSPQTSGFSVEEGRDVETLFFDDAEDMEAWTASEATHEKIQSWQPSDSATPKVRDNIKRSGKRSFWTGVAAQDQTPGGFAGSKALGETAGESWMTLKEWLTLPADRSTILTYWSDFANDRDDLGRVEAGVRNGDDVEWSTVDVVTGTTHAVGDYPPGEAFFEKRSVDLSDFAGQEVLLRFAYVLPAPWYVNVLRSGWYVDDIELFSTRFTEIARTAADATSYGVTAREPGTYAYRIRALFADGGASSPSNAERTRVAGEPAPPPEETTSSNVGQSSGAADNSASGPEAGAPAAGTPASTAARVAPPGDVRGVRRKSPPSVRKAEVKRKRALRLCLRSAGRKRSRSRRAAAKRACHRRYGPRSRLRRSGRAAG